MASFLTPTRQQLAPRCSYQSLMSLTCRFWFWYFLIDLPRVLSMPVYVYLPRGMEAYLACPVDSNPPVTKITWTKDGRRGELDYSASRGRLRNKNGTLVFRSVISEDAGMYSCSATNAHGSGTSSPQVQIYVKGTSDEYMSIDSTVIVSK